MSEAQGFLFIGDPHISSRRPSRRSDRNFGEAVLKKIQAAIEIANERKLIPIFLGDMFDRPVEEDESLKTRLLRTLKGCWRQPLSALGNHDIAHSALGDGDSIAYLAESGALHLMHTSGPVGVFTIGKRRIALGSTPHGQVVPHDVTEAFEEQHDGVIWITHHDVAFEGAYPGAMLAHEIKGCKLVVNGHMHLTKKMVQAGGTSWFNPGNITRMAIDAANHVPRVWELNADGQLTPHDIPHEKAPFNFTGLLVEAISPGEYREEEQGAEGEQDEGWRSTFVDLLAAERPEDLERTHDGSLAREAVEEKFKRDGTERPVRLVVLDLLEEITAEENAA